MINRQMEADDDDEDDDSMVRPFECGHWCWSDVEGCLVFMSDVPPKREETAIIKAAVPLTTCTFKEIDLVEQMRFKRRYQRKLKPHEPDIITLQDIKDLAIYTAPLAIMSSSLINVLHIPTAERYIRSLILYCHYYLQIGQEMVRRVGELQSKIRTPKSEEIEATYRQNLIDLRRLVAKEYSIFLCGVWDTKVFHHMGESKSRKSLSHKDTRLIETFTLMCTQIVWIALGRRSFNQIELEISRITKTDFFNSVEHRLKTGYYKSLSPLERDVLIGPCIPKNPKQIARSPLMNDLLCKQEKPIDYKMMGIGAIQYDYLSERLRYLLMAIAGPEESLDSWNVTVGILGKSRAHFDTALNLLDLNLTSGRASSTSASSRTSTSSKKKSYMSKMQQGESVFITKDSTKLYGYADIELPGDEIDDFDKFPLAFPATNAKIRYCNKEQHLQWMRRFHKMLNRSDRRQ